MNNQLENYINNIPKNECEAYGHWFVLNNEEKFVCVKCDLPMEEEHD